MTNPSRIFIDASVVLTYLLPTDIKTKVSVRKLFSSLDESKLTISSIPLLYPEVANGLRYTLTDSNLANEYYELFVSIPMEIYQLTKEEHLFALKLAYQNNTTVYDASYHYASILHSSVLYTLDHEYYKKAHQFGHIKLIV